MHGNAVRTCCSQTGATACRRSKITWLLVPASSADDSGKAAMSRKQLVAHDCFCCGVFAQLRKLPALQAIDLLRAHWPCRFRNGCVQSTSCRRTTPHAVSHAAKVPLKLQLCITGRCLSC